MGIKPLKYMAEFASKSSVQTLSRHGLIGRRGPVCVTQSRSARQACRDPLWPTCRSQTRTQLFWRPSSDGTRRTNRRVD